MLAALTKSSYPFGLGIGRGGGGVRAPSNTAAMIARLPATTSRTTYLRIFFAAIFVCLSLPRPKPSPSHNAETPSCQGAEIKIISLHLRGFAPLRLIGDGLTTVGCRIE